MNRLEYKLLSLKSSNSITTNDCYRLTDYIMNNNIIEISNNLINNYELFNNLLVSDYDKLFEMNFNIESFYKDIEKVWLVSYINKFGVSERLKELIKNDWEVCREYIDWHLGTENNGDLLDLFTRETYLKLDTESRIKYFKNAVNYLKFDFAYFDNNPELLLQAIKERKSEERTAFAIKLLKTETSSDVRKYIVEWIVNGFINFDSDQLNELNIDLNEMANTIIEFKNAIAIAPVFRANHELFKLLLDKGYTKLLWPAAYETFPKEFYQMHMDLISNMFLKHAKEPKLIVISDLLKSIYIELNKNGKLSDDSIFAFGDYIANHLYEFVVTDFVKPLVINDIRLFNYLYDLDVDFLFELNISKSILEQIPKEKRDEYYRHHPNIKIDELRNSLLQYYRTRSKGLDTEELSFSVTNMLKNFSAEDAYIYHSNDFEMIQRLLNIDKEQVLTVLRAVKDKNSTDIFIEMLKRAKSVSKEEEANNLTYLCLERIHNSYGTLDKEAYYKTLRKRKRQDLYYNYLKKINIKNEDSNENEASIATLDEMKRLIWPIIDSLDQELDESQFLRIIFKDTVDYYIREPANYKYYKNQKDLNRLSQNYTKVFDSMVYNNPNKEYVIKFVTGALSYDNAKKYIDKKDLSALIELKSIANAANISISIVDDKINFQPNYQISRAEMAAITKYEELMQTIKKVKNLMHRHIDLLYPADKIEITESDEETYGNTNDILTQIIDFSGKRNFIKIVEEYKQFRTLYSDPTDLAYFDKLFLTNKFIYCLCPILEDPHFDFREARQFDDSLREVAQNIPIVRKYFTLDDLSIDKIGKIQKVVSVYKYCNNNELAILGNEVGYKIVSNSAFIGQDNPEKMKNRVKNGAKYVALASGKSKSTVPFLTTSSDGINITRYNNNDPDILTAGIDTNSCFKLQGNDNDFLLYTIFDKNGFILRITDDAGNFIGRVSGFRNGNTIYMNQLRTKYDISGETDVSRYRSIDTVRKALEDYARKLLEVTKESANPIDNVFITKSYGYGDCEYLPIVPHDIIDNSPMELASRDFEDFSLNPELEMRGSYERGTDNGFITDYYYSSYQVLALAVRKRNASINEGIIKLTKKDIRNADIKPYYDRPRQTVVTYDEENINQTVIDKINSINARYIYWGDTAKREKNISEYQLITDSSDMRYAICGEDFYITVYKSGKIKTLCLPYDKRASNEYNKYMNIIFDMFEKDKYEVIEVNTSKKR